LDSNGTVLDLVPATFNDQNVTFLSKEDNKTHTLEKGDLLGIAVESVKPSVLGTVSQFSVFNSSVSEGQLKYSAYREEIIRNEAPEDE